MQTHSATPEQAREYFEAKIAFTAGPMEVSRMLRDDERVRIVDVRAKEDFDKGHVPSAVNLPQDEWGNLDRLAKDKLNVVYCYSLVCHLAARAAAAFAAKGFKVLEMEGGFSSWKDHGLEVEASTTSGNGLDDLAHTFEPTH